MRAKKSKSRNNNTRIAIFFFVFIVIVFLISFFLKAALVIKHGKFDSNNRFTISVSSKGTFKLISFSPTGSISILKLDGNIKKEDINKFLQIPIDGEISQIVNDNEKIPTLMKDALFGYKDIKTDLTIIDILRLFLFSRNVSPNLIYSKNVSADMSAGEVDKIVSSLFQDASVQKENMAIEIINGTDVTGLGNRLARLITNMGANVIIVGTSDVPEETSVISYSKKNYTVEKLGKLLGFKLVKKDKRELANITITIGKDGLSKLHF